MDTPTNPLAFPSHTIAEGSDSSYTDQHWKGMTLRDYFAAKFMASFINALGSECTILDDWTEARVADSYFIADKMLRHRIK